jgi:pSer/pThr/pTyr-binding forkhead associated (FHA) protein
MGEWHVRLNDRVLQRFWIDEGGRLTIGRGKAADVILDNTAVSREHAVLEMRQGVLHLTDLDSTNGTRVNGEIIKGSVTIAPVDQIEIAKFVLVPETKKEKPNDSVTPNDFEGTVFIRSEEKAPSKQKKGVPRLTVVKGKAVPEQMEIATKKTVTLGRDPSCDVRIPCWFVAKIQCYISVRNGIYYLSHKNGWKATRLNGRKLEEEKQLHKGDIIEIGTASLRFG